MDYLSGKDWKYHLKSGLATFLSVFVPLFISQIAMFDLSNLTAGDVTVDGGIAVAIAVFRVAMVSIAQAVVMTAKKNS